MRPEELAIILSFAVGGAFLLSPVMIVRMVIQHREKLAAMKNRQEGAPALVEEMTALRRELAQVRDNATHYDLSFDAALSRVESRMDKVEAARDEETARAMTYPVVPGTSQENEVETLLRARR